jgi:hypothetical protein
MSAAALVLALALAGQAPAAQTADGSPPKTVAPPDPSANADLVADAVARWEAASGVAVTQAVRAPLIKETARQLAHAPADIDHAAVVDTAVDRYLEQGANYRRVLRQTLEAAAAPPPPPPPPPPMVPAPPAPAAASPKPPPPAAVAVAVAVAAHAEPPFIVSILQGLGDGVGGLFGPVHEAWNVTLLADRVSPTVWIDGAPQDRFPNDIYRVSGNLVRIELDTAAGHCQRKVRPSNARADCR